MVREAFVFTLYVESDILHEWMLIRFADSVFN